MLGKIAPIILVFSMMYFSSTAFAVDDSELILKILVKKGIVTEAEIAQMRMEIASQRTGPPPPPEAPKPAEERVASVEKDLLSKVGLDKISSKLSLKGRWAAGYFDSDESGSFNNGSFQIPEAKVQFTFKPDDINSIIMRMNLNNAAFNNLDYFYIDTNIMKLTPWEGSPFTLISRLGRFKVDYGEETFSNNPAESILPSNSAANVAGNDEGLMFSGKIGRVRPANWSFAVMNGNSGTGADNNWLKAFSGKLSYNIIDPLYVSGSYYNSGNLDTQSSEMTIAGLAAPPTGAVKWLRQMFEVDARYDFKKGKVLNPPAYCDSLAFVRAAYGHFIDDASPTAPGTAAVADREGDYAFVEIMYNITKKLYAAARASFVGLNGTANTASFNNITANNYERYSFGLGYRMTDATLVKGAYDINLGRKGAGGEDPKDNLLSLLVSSQF